MSIQADNMYKNVSTNSEKLISKQKTLIKGFTEKKYEFDFSQIPYSFDIEGAEFSNYVPYGESEMVNQIRSIKNLLNTSSELALTNLSLPKDEKEWFLLTSETGIVNQIRYKLIHEEFEKYCDLYAVRKYNVKTDIELGVRVYAYLIENKMIFLYFDPHHLIATQNRDRYTIAKQCNMCISEI